jgi:SAM-dependent methyltransferase
MTESPGSMGSGDEASSGHRCRACGEPGPGERHAIREMMFGTRQSFDYERCTACGSLSIIEIPDDLALHYPARYYSNAARVAVDAGSPIERAVSRSAVGRRVFGHRTPLSRFVRRRVPAELSEVEPLIRLSGLASFDDPILDVGCGAEPYRLVIFRKLGFRRLLGIEPFISGDVHYGGVLVRRMQLDALEDPQRLIMFHHSLEHVPDPLSTLLRARDLLLPGGCILVRTPMADGWLWRTYGTSWVELDAPRHTVVFSHAGLARLADRAGFDVVATTWESGHWELIASEQYRRDIGMYEPASWFVDPDHADFDAAAIEGYRAEARRLNAAGDAGRAAIWLRPRGTTPVAGRR